MKKLKWLIAALLLIAAVLGAAWFWLPQDIGLSQRQQTLLQQAALPDDAVIARLVVRKGAREMDAFNSSGKLLKTYPVSLGFQPQGHK